MPDHYNVEKVRSVDEFSTFWVLYLVKRGDP